jgi:hypothetical protein
VPFLSARVRDALIPEKSLRGVQISCGIVPIRAHRPQSLAGIPLTRFPDIAHHITGIFSPH